MAESHHPNSLLLVDPYNSTRRGGNDLFLFMMRFRQKLPRELRETVYDNLFSPSIWIRLPLNTTQPTQTSFSPIDVLTALHQYRQLNPDHAEQLAEEINKRFFSTGAVFEFLEFRTLPLGLRGYSSLTSLPLDIFARRLVVHVFQDDDPRTENFWRGNDYQVRAPAASEPIPGFNGAFQPLLHMENGANCCIDFVLATYGGCVVQFQLAAIMPTAYELRRKGFTVRMRSFIEKTDENQPFVHDFTALLEREEEDFVGKLKMTLPWIHYIKDFCTPCFDLTLFHYPPGPYEGDGMFRMADVRTCRHKEHI
ncbi:hypothetical protein CC80DRAFT_493541 [Byssothecium circinans]|uniref:Uncharacterized protein n=1 Tax=Byssothecium circinans TaxID=147558 RepID=A0A6A5TPZ7_9PLEO|nr:hypothetical protein CC80DRAFT_493541 [Byssothecium circinans]